MLSTESPRGYPFTIATVYSCVHSPGCARLTCGRCLNVRVERVRGEWRTVRVERVRGEWRTVLPAAE